VLEDRVSVQKGMRAMLVTSTLAIAAPLVFTIVPTTVDAEPTDHRTGRVYATLASVESDATPYAEPVTVTARAMASVPELCVFAKSDSADLTVGL
jgi:hypothetical protein